MAHWTRTEDAVSIILDNGAGHLYIAHKHLTHFHAEEIMLWSEDGQGRLNVEDIVASFLASRAAAGDTIS